MVSVCYLSNPLSWFNLAASNQAPDSHSIIPPPPPQWDGEENGQKVKLMG